MKMYTLEVNEKELIRIFCLVGKSTGYTGGDSSYIQAVNLLNLDRQQSFRILNSVAIQEQIGSIDYAKVQKELEELVKKSGECPVRQKIETLQKELDELKKLV